ncbi:MAG: hypothetical protein WB470_16870 [Candidatus Acidiferrales bacterium]
MSTVMQVGPSNPSTVGGLGTNFKYFPATPGASIGVPSLNNGYLPIPGNNVSNGQSFTVRAAGNFAVGDVTSAVRMSLFPVTFISNFSTASIVPVPVFSLIAVGLANINTPYPWMLRIDLCGDTGSGLVQAQAAFGLMDGQTGGTPSSIVSGLSGINFSNSIPYGLVIGVAFTESNAGNTANCYQFGLF